MEADQKFRLACVRCPWVGLPAMLFTCPACGGALEARLSLAGARIRRSDIPERTYLDLLPIGSPEFLEPGISRPTPCRPASRLGAAIGVPRLWVKDESAQPTGSTKDRLAAVVLPVFREFGVKEFVASSTGNTATALARAVEHDGALRGQFFCGRRFLDRHRRRGDGVVLTVVDGSYAQATAAAREHSRQHGLFWEGGFFNWARREGLKTAYLEAFDAMTSPPGLVVQAVSSGMGILAAAKGAREYLALGRLRRMPRFLLVQQDGCAPMVTAWRAGRSRLDERDVVAEPDGLAQAILLGDARSSYPYLYDVVTAAGGDMVAVAQQDLVRIRELAGDLEGLDVGYSSAAAVAGLERHARSGMVGDGETVLVNLTGGVEAG